MAYAISRVEIWAGEIEDRPGALAQQLECLARAGANLEAVILRPAAPLSGTGVLFVAPLIGDEQERAARHLGLRETRSIRAVRVEGPDRPGLIAHVARLLADAGMNISGLSSGVAAGHGVHYLRFDTEDDAEQSAALLRERLK
jgi:hypothetical protein